MPRRANPVPTYRFHKKTGRAVVTVVKVTGQRTEVLLPGPHGSQESQAEYQRLLATLRANDGRLPLPRAAAGSLDLTIDELVERFLDEKVALEGHRYVRMTDHDSGVDLELATEVARKMGERRRHGLLIRGRPG